MRRAMGEQAISLAKAVGYNSAGQYYKYICSGWELNQWYLKKNHFNVFGCNNSNF